MEQIKAFGVFRLGGSIGGYDVEAKIKRFSGQAGKLVESFDTNEEAKDYAKRMRKLLSPGEKSYYGLTYRSSSTEGLEKVK